MTLIVTRDCYIFGDENNWKTLMAIHGALAAFNPQEDLFEYSERLIFTLPPTELLRMQRRKLFFLVVVGQRH